MTINSGQVIQGEPVKLDPNFFLPPNLIGVVYKYEETLEDDAPKGEEEASNTFTVEQSDGSYGTLADTNEVVVEKLPVPGKVTLVSQTSRIVAGGPTVVDVVLEIPDMPGISEVDVRVSKVL